ncbi:hypothetical protein CUU95_18540 [Vreelandella alkaliphila]|nr:hypothetical protein CUU95_18540 [Halomonas alkaliphila]
MLNLALATGRMTTAQYMQAMGMLQESFQAAQRETENTAKASEDASQRIVNSFLSWETVADNTLRRVDDSGQSLWLGLIDGSESALDTVKRLPAIAGRNRPHAHDSEANVSCGRHDGAGYNGNAGWWWFKSRFPGRSG